MDMVMIVIKIKIMVVIMVVIMVMIVIEMMSCLSIARKEMMEPNLIQDGKKAFALKGNNKLS